MAEEIVALSRTDAQKLVSQLDKAGTAVVKGYYAMIALVAKARDTKLYLSVPDGDGEIGYKNIYDMCADRYGMSRGTVGNLLKIFKQFYDYETYKPLPDFANLSYSQLLSEIPERKKDKTSETAESAETEETAESTETEGEGVAVEIIEDVLISSLYEVLNNWIDDHSLASRVNVTITEREFRVNI